MNSPPGRYMNFFISRRDRYMEVWISRQGVLLNSKYLPIKC